jgi:hypothetical protein
MVQIRNRRIFLICAVVPAAATAVFMSLLALCAGGKGEGALINKRDAFTAPAYVLELDDAGIFGWRQGSPDLGQLPPDTLSSRTIQVLSRRSKPMENVRVISTCGCTTAAFTPRVLGPNEEGELSFTYDSRGKRGTNEIRLTLVADGRSDDRYYVKLRCTIVDSLSSLHLSVTPSAINVDEVWKRPLQKEYLLRLVTLDKRIDVARMTVRGSKPYIQAHMEIGDEPTDTTYITVKLSQPPSGIIGESVSLFYSCAGYDYEVRVPIEGRVRAPYSASPSIVSLGGISSRENGSAIVDVVANDEAAGEPMLNVEGDWEIDKVVFREKSKYRVYMVLRESLLSKYCAGKLLIGGNRGEERLQVPIFATLSKPQTVN